MAEMMANSALPKDRASSGAAMLLSAGLMTPLTIAPSPIYRVRM